MQNNCFSEPKGTLQENSTSCENIKLKKYSKQGDFNNS